jgi:hypothetical protein
LPNFGNPLAKISDVLICTALRESEPLRAPNESAVQGHRTHTLQALRLAGLRFSKQVLQKQKRYCKAVPFLFLVSQLQTKSNLIYTLSTALLSLSITLLNSNITNNIKKLQLKN